MKLMMIALSMSLSFSALAQNISVTVDGREYSCSGSGSSHTKLVKTFCICESYNGYRYLRLYGIMSDGTKKLIDDKVSSHGGCESEAENSPQCKK